MTYEMLTGEPPFTGPTAQAIVAQACSRSSRARSAPSGTPFRPHVEHAVLIALQKLPADRFGTPTEFADALEGKPAPTPRPGRR